MVVKQALKDLANPKNVKFADLLKICKAAFGEPRIDGSHHIFKVPWQGQPWVNIQKDGKMAKDYQVKQAVKALEKLAQQNAEKEAEEKAKPTKKSEGRK